jgi:hypothetical protein
LGNTTTFQKFFVPPTWSWDIGIPPWVQMMLKAILQHYQLKNIHELWPSLSLYVSGGVAFENYKESFEELLGHPIHYQDTYLASEGYFAYNHRPVTMAMKLALQHGVFFEFVPFDERGFDASGQLLDHPLTLTINQTGEDYAIGIHPGWCLALPHRCTVLPIQIRRYSSRVVPNIL